MTLNPRLHVRKCSPHAEVASSSPGVFGTGASIALSGKLVLACRFVGRIALDVMCTHRTSLTTKSFIRTGA